MPGGALADKLGAKNVMTATLLFSGLCCVAVPLLAAPFGDPHPHSAAPSPTRTLTHPHPHSAASSLTRTRMRRSLARTQTRRRPPSPPGLLGVWCAIALMGAFQGPMFPTSSVRLCPPNPEPEPEPEPEPDPEPPQHVEP